MRIAMMMMVLLGSLTAAGQTDRPQKILTKELELVVENDVFLSLIRDQYYSSGIFGSFRHAVDSAKTPRGVINSSRRYSIIQRMYTSKFVEVELIEEMDRPYAGIFSLAAQQDYFLANRQYLSVGFELGWMGPTSFTGEIHETWHRFFGLPAPRGWFSQLNNAPVLNGYINHAIELTRSTGEVQGDISSASELAFGTIYNSISQGLLFRFGKTKAIHQSTHFGNRLNTPKPLVKSEIAVEAYIFYHPKVQFVAYDGTLQGGLISSGESQFTKDPVKWRLLHSFGLLLRYGVFDFNFIVYLQPPETSEVTSHSYGSLGLRQRF